MLTLAAGASSVVVAPELGGGLIGWMRGRTPILRRALPQACVGGDAFAMGCFPLLPYGNRIGHARFPWLGSACLLQRNFGDQPHNIHGIGWQRAWTLERVDRQAVLLSLEHRPDVCWPFAFRAEIGYTLTAASLTVALQITNRHDGPAPGGIGLHPHFPKTNAPTLRFNATGGWQNGADALPSRHGPVPEEWQHDEARAVAVSRLDNCFTGWDGVAEIIAGPASLRIEASDPFAMLQVFTPSWADFFCVEPVSHVPDALNRADLPVEQAMTVLDAGAVLRGTIRFTLIG